MENSKTSVESLWAVDDVAKYLQASRSWVYQRAASGELPARRIGGLLRFDPQEIIAWSRGERTEADREITLPKRTR